MNETIMTGVPRRIKPKAKWAGFSTWQEGLIFSGRVATPARHLWQAYNQFCDRWGFDKAKPATFMRWLGEMEGCRLTQAGPNNENVLSGAVIGETDA